MGNRVLCLVMLVLYYNCGQLKKEIFVVNMANTTVCLPHHGIQHFAVKLSEGKCQDASSGGQICISLSHKFVLSCMCVVTTYLCTNTRKQTGCSLCLNMLITTDVPSIPCDNLTAKCCNSQTMHGIIHGIIVTQRSIDLKETTVQAS